MRCEFLKEHRGELGPIGKARGILRVSKSEYHGYVKRRKSDAQIGREALEGFVAEGFDLHKGRYGYHRINRELRRDGIVDSEKRVLAVVRKLGLQAKGASRKHKRAKAVEMGDPRVNLVDRAFDVEARNKPWAGDITCIGAGEGWLCLATATDAFHREVAGWSMSGRMAEKLVADALGQAVGRGAARRLQPRLPRRPGFPVHFSGVPAPPRVPWNRPIHVAAGQPMGQRARGILLQDAQARAGERQGLQDEGAAKQDVFKYIELYCNRQRMHSSIGYSAPCDLERDVDRRSFFPSKKP